MKLLRRIFSAAALTRTACYIGLAALALMAYSIFVPTPTPVLLSMSLGQGLGALAFLCYLSAILLEIRRFERVQATLTEEQKTAANERASGNPD